VPDLSESIKIEKYLAELDPIIWLSTADWFRFVKTRVAHIHIFQDKLTRFKTRAENHGILTAILNHTLQHIGVTPIVLEPHIRSALRDVRFDAVSTRFGCFFIHNLDLESGVLPEVPPQDPPEMLLAMGVKSTKPKKARRGILEVPSADMLIWNDLVTILNGAEADHRVRVKEFKWDPMWMAFSAAREVFCAFTKQYWGVFTSQAFSDNKKPDPSTLQEAMEYWTLAYLKSRLLAGHSTAVIPSADELRGNVPHKSKAQRFSIKRTAFFPEPDTIPIQESKLSPFFHHQNGWISQYHEAIKDSADEGKGLRDALDGIFTVLQLLPLNPGKPLDKRPLWGLEQNAIKVLFNSKYIQLKHRTLVYKHGTKREERLRGSNKLKNNAQVTHMLDAGGRLAPRRRLTKAARKSKRADEKEIMQGRRGKRRNYRKPPVRRRKAAELEAPSLDPSGGGEEPQQNPAMNTRGRARARLEPNLTKDGSGDRRGGLPPMACIMEEEEEEEEEDEREKREENHEEEEEEEEEEREEKHEEDRDDEGGDGRDEDCRRGEEDNYPGDDDEEEEDDYDDKDYED
jgi:hypothetical protein